MQQNERPEQHITPSFDGLCDLSPIWELTLSWTLGVEAWMAKVQIIYVHVVAIN